MNLRQIKRKFHWLQKTQSNRWQRLPTGFPLMCQAIVQWTDISKLDEIPENLDFYLNEDTASQDNPFYQYCNGDATTREANYKEAFVEVINCALRGIIDQDGLCTVMFVSGVYTSSGR